MAQQSHLVLLLAMLASIASCQQQPITNSINTPTSLTPPSPSNGTTMSQGEGAEQAGQEIVIVRLPQLEAASPAYVRVHDKQSLALQFASDVMTVGTGVLLSIRGAGYWNLEVECITISPTNVTCPLPLFQLTGVVDIKVQFNESSPLLPLGHRVLVWDLKLENLLPSIIPFASMNKTVVLMGQGMFRDEFRNNLVVFLQGSGVPLKLTNNSITLLNSFTTNVQLPRSLEVGRYQLFASVDEGTTQFTCDKCVITVYAPSYDSRRLAFVPSAAPLDGGTAITLHGLYHMMLTEEALRIQLQASIITAASNNVTSFRLSAPISSNDQLQPFTVLATNPIFQFVAPAAPVSGFFTTSIGYADYLTPIPLNFLYYDLRIEAIQPMSSLLSHPAKTLTLYSRAFPRTGMLQMRFGQRLASPAGTFAYKTVVDCTQALSQSIPGSNSSEAFEVMKCSLPEVAASPQKGTVLTLEVSANGIDFSDRLPLTEIVFHEPVVTEMSPLHGPLAGQNVSILGHGFVDVTGMFVQLTMKGTGAKMTVPVTFVGEGQLRFTVPKPFGATPSGSLLSCALLPTGEASTVIALPDFQYDTVVPSLASVIVDSGNRESETVSTINSTITIRLTSASRSISKIVLKSFTVGTVSVLDKVTVAAVDDQRMIWTLRYVVSEGNQGEVNFIADLINDQNNVATVNSLTGPLDKKIVVDTTRPQLRSLAITSGNPGNPTRAASGNTIAILLETSVPLKALVVLNFTIGSNVVSDTSQSVIAQSVGGYPSYHWKVQYTVPAEHKPGLVHFVLLAISSIGNTQTFRSDDLEVLPANQGVFVAE